MALGVTCIHYGKYSYS